MNILAIKQFKDILEAAADTARTHDAFVTVCELLREMEIREDLLQDEMEEWEGARAQTPDYWDDLEVC